MRYERYLELNRDKWAAFEEHLERLEKTPKNVAHNELEELSVEYRKVLHDHAFAYSRFPGTWANEYLRRLAVRANHLLQWTDQAKRSGLVAFFVRHFPNSFRQLSGEILVCTALFIVSAVLGAGLSALDPK